MPHDPSPPISGCRPGRAGHGSVYGHTEPSRKVGPLRRLPSCKDAQSQCQRYLSCWPPHPVSESVSCIVCLPSVSQRLGACRPASQLFHAIVKRESSRALSKSDVTVEAADLLPLPACGRGLSFQLLDTVNKQSGTKQAAGRAPSAPTHCPSHCCPSKTLDPALTQQKMTAMDVDLPAGAGPSARSVAAPVTAKHADAEGYEMPW